MRRLAGVAGVVLCGFAEPGAARIAPAPAPTHEPVMRMAVVRSNDPSCAQRCSDWIALNGPVGVGSAAKFAHLVQSLGRRRLPVLVNSQGGSVRDAMAMGRLIRARHLDVAVSKTALTSCPGDRIACATFAPDGMVTGTPVTAGSFCASSCSLILAGGERRFVAYRTFVGVHQFRSFRSLTKVVRTFRLLTRKVNGVTVEVSRTLVSERPVSTSQIAVQTTPAAYGEAQRYFAAMGIAPTLMALAEATTPDSIHWLTLAELVSTRMDTEGKDGAFLIAHAPADPPTTPAQPSAAPPPAAVRPAADDATLASEDAGDRKALQLTGPAVWSVDESPPFPTLTALIALPDGAGSIKIAMKDLGPVGAPNYHLALTLTPGAESSFRRLLAVGLPAVREGADQPPIDLQATVGPTVQGTFNIDLPTTGPAADADRRLISRGQDLEFPLVVFPLRSLRLKLPLGPSERDAFTRWRTLVDARLPAG